MTSLEEITAVENRYVCAGRLPSSGEALDLILARWQVGGRDRETALRLMFLSWYSQTEPPYLTGLSGDLDTKILFGEAFKALGGAQTNDPEVCFAVGTMATVFPQSLGVESQWQVVGQRLLARAAALAPEGVRRESFIGRGAYGAYFAQGS
ncbi:MAG: hypothetical protein ABIS07_13830 [Dokdonella sp.]